MKHSNLLRSFAFGFRGLAYCLRSEPNMRLHGVAAMAVVGAGWYFRVAAWEWMAISLCIGLVVAAECLNTALERLADRVCPTEDPLIKHAKDCGAAAVLAIAITSVVIGGLVFVPKVWLAAGW